MNSFLVFGYNFVRRHEALSGMTPMQRMGIADHRWTFTEIVRLADAYCKEQENACFAAAFASGKFVEYQRPRNGIKKRGRYQVYQAIKDKPVLTEYQEKGIQPPAPDWSGVPDSWKNPQQIKNEREYPRSGIIL